MAVKGTVYMQVGIDIHDVIGECSDKHRDELAVELFECGHMTPVFEEIAKGMTDDEVKDMCARYGKDLMYEVIDRLTKGIEID